MSVKNFRCISLIGTLKFLNNFCEIIVPSKAYVALEKIYKFLKKKNLKFFWNGKLFLLWFFENKSLRKINSSLEFQILKFWKMK